MKRTLKSRDDLPAWLKYRSAIALELSQSDWHNLNFREIVDHFKIDDNPFDFGLIGNKDFPSFAESIQATLERLTALEEILNFFNKIDSIICVVNGGSMSYGRFYSVRREPPSDIDFIVVLNNWPNSIFKLVELFSQSRIFDPESVNLMAKKAKVFCSHPEFTDEKAIFSHKLKLWPYGFDLSCHFMPVDLAKLYFMAETNLDRHELVLIKEYRQNKTSHIIRNDFLGGEDLAGLEESTVDFGFASQVVAYAILNDLFYAGQYQCLIFPCLEILIDKGIKAKIMAEAFKQKLLARFYYEKAKHGESIGLYKIHLRHPVFNPLIVRPIWGETI